MDLPDVRPGRLYFLDQRFIDRFNGRGVMLDHEGPPAGGLRPHLIVFEDRRHKGIFWAVPLSSQLDKYKSLRAQKAERYGFCDTIIIERIQARESAFLIQNICPVRPEDLKAQWMRKDGSRRPMTVPPAAAARIARAAASVLSKAPMNPGLVFTDYRSIYGELVLESALEKAMPVLQSNPWLLTDRLTKLQPMKDGNSYRYTFCIDVDGSGTPAGIHAIERTDVVNSKGNVVSFGRPQATPITDPLFLRHIESAAAADWDRHDRKPGRRTPPKDKGQDGFDERLDDAEKAAGAEGGEGDRPAPPPESQQGPRG